jgi:lysophospholipase L1-like esterase
MPDPNVRFIAFGDSTTAGPTDRQYWQILQEKLNQPPEAFAGQGQGGETSAEGITRLQDLIDRGIYPNAQVLLYWEGGDDLVEFVKDKDPLLLLSPGDQNYPFATQLNDKLATLQTNIEQAISMAQNAGWKVYVATYYPLEENKPCKALPLPLLLAPQAINANAYVIKLNERIRQAAANRSATLVDVATIAESLKSDPANYVDCNHLSDQGNELVADLFFRVISQSPP